MSPVTGLWLLFSLIGMVFAISNARIALGDRGTARDMHNHRRQARLIVADGAVFRTRVRLGVFVWWVLLGIGFGFFDLPELPRLAGLLGLLATVLGLALTGAQETRERRRLDAMLFKEEAAMRRMQAKDSSH